MEEGSKPSGRRPFLKLTQCPNFDEARAMLADGISPWAVAEWLQSKGQYVSVKIGSLARQLSRFRDQVIGTNEGLKSKSLIDRRLAHIDLKKIDDVDELTKLILVQKERVEKDLKLEAKLPKTLKDLSKEIIALFDMIEKRVRLMQELGIVPRAPTTHLVATATLRDALNSMVPDDRAKIRSMIQGAYLKSKVVGVVHEGSVSSGGDGDKDGGRHPEVPVASDGKTDPGKVDGSVLPGG
jgi:hypothetical protein